MKPPASQSRASGFTRTELLVALATLALLAAATRPVWGNGGLSKSLLCLDNLRRLQAAWLLYTSENAGVLPGNYHGGFVPGAEAPERPWATGWLDWQTRPDNTNTTYLTEPRYASLAVYLNRDVTVYKCPADEYLSPTQLAQGWAARVRTYSMNCFMGQGNQTSGPLNFSYTIFRKLADFRKLSPQQALVFLEEHPDSVNDPLFWAPNSNQSWPDVPGALHEGATWLTFADGHVEARRWTDPKLLQPVKYQYNNNLTVTPNHPDLVWLLAHASEPVR
jgi:hypothetical protein